MKFIRDSFVEWLVKGAALRAMKWVENWNDTDLETNGEVAFLNDLFRHYSQRCRGTGVTAIDAGAHIGGYISAIHASAKTANVAVEVHAFEPVAATYLRLSSRLGGRADVKLNQCGLSEETGSASIFLRKDASSQASLYERSAGLSESAIERQSIRTVRLDEYIDAQGISHLHLLKLDVEGSEYRVLKGAGKYLEPAFMDFIQFEYGGTNLDSGIPLKFYFDLLEAAGFVVARQVPGGLKVRGYRPWMDNYANANYVAISRKVYDQIIH